MAGGARAQPTIIIKKVKKAASEGHHGGAWKVAYADFVTAMMAFFLLMWLLNATTEEQRKGLADYFNPTIPISKVSGGGSDALDGSSMMTDDSLARDGAGATDAFPAPEDAKTAEAIEMLEAIEESIERQVVEELSNELAEHIVTRMTPDGLLIELIDKDGEPLFSLGSAEPSALLAELIRVVAPVLATAANRMSVVGHTDARVYQGARYSNWELSTDRANAARRLLVAEGFPAAQIAAVTGKAETEPFSDNPLAAQNRRIALLLLTLEKSSARPPAASLPAVRD